jgi:SulP family sulfate permease
MEACVATVVDIDGELYKQRSPTGAWLLTLVTLLVYWFVWYYKINDEARRYLRDQSVKPWVAVLAIFPGLLLLLVPLLISVFRTGQRIERMERQAGITQRIRPVWGSVFSFAAILAPLFFGATVGAAKTYAARDGYQISPNRELVGLGAANMAAGLSSGMVVNGSLSKTAVNGSAGARTQASGLAVAVLTVITLLFLTGLFEDLPEATLSAVVIAALIELVDYKALQALYRAYSLRLGKIYGLAARADFIAAVAAMLGVLIFDTLPGLVIGELDSLLLLLYRVSRPHVAVLGEIPGSGGQWADTAVHPEDRTVPGVSVLRVEAGLFFGNADYVQAAIQDAAGDGIGVVVLDCETMPSIDVTAARMLSQLAADFRRRGVQLVLAGEIGQVRDMLAVVSGPYGSPEYHRTVQDAVDSARTGPAVPGPPGRAPDGTT